MRINPNQICSIRVHEQLAHRFFVFYEEKKFLGLTTRKEGFYYTALFENNYYTNEVIEELYPNCFIGGMSVFYRPHIEVHMSNKQIHTKYFESIDEMHEFLNRDEYYHVKRFN